jgi:hypothetical protein
MSTESNAEDVREFFDRQQSDRQYESLKKMTEELDLEAAEQLNTRVHGNALSIGGIWDHFEWGDNLTDLTVLDLSPEMLKVYCPERAVGVVGDVYEFDFPPESFDSIVFPLMLHHTPQGNWASCEARVELAIDRARSWLRPDGHLFILEYCPQPAWIPLERGLLPVTTWFLTKFKQPLVVMYPRSFYERVLNRRFGSSEIDLVDPPGFNYRKWYPIFMSIRWLKVPMSVYPKLHVMTAPAMV